MATRVPLSGCPYQGHEDRCVIGNHSYGLIWTPHMTLCICLLGAVVSSDADNVIYTIASNEQRLTIMNN